MQTHKPVKEAPDWNVYFTFNNDTGVLAWKVKRPGPTTAIGQEAGSIKSDGRYRSFVLFHKRYYTHRVAWEMTNGPIGEGMCIDHIDGNGLNNSLSNLRITTLSGNQRNRCVGKSSRTGVTGVNHTKSGFTVTCGGVYIGHFMSLDMAIAARRSAEPQYGYIVNNRKNNHANT